MWHRRAATYCGWPGRPFGPRRSHPAFCPNNSSELASRPPQYFNRPLGSRAATPVAIIPTELIDDTTFGFMDKIKRYSLKARSLLGHRTSATHVLGMQHVQFLQPSRGQLARQKCCARSTEHAASRRCAPALLWPITSGRRVRKSCRLSRSDQRLIAKSRFRSESAQCQWRVAHTLLRLLDALAPPVLALRWWKVGRSHRESVLARSLQQKFRLAGQVERHDNDTFVPRAEHPRKSVGSGCWRYGRSLIEL